MSYHAGLTESEHYFNICGFLTDAEVNQIFDIVENSLDRSGWKMHSNAELSIRVYDDNLKKNVSSDTTCEPEPCGTEHPYYYEW
tara:strand:+ start:544 stop:795 length:252 start_codon:yes stop_codon:yes gene_type:complete